MDKNQLIADSFANAILSMSCAFALRDALLITAEQKELYNSKQKEYIKKFFLEFSQKYNLENPEEFYEKLLKQAPLG